MTNLSSFLYVGLVSLTAAPTAARAAMGMGMVAPALVPRVLHFYAKPDLLALTVFPDPIDSVVFVQGQYHVEIASTPPWFMPAHMKLDYELLLLRAITVSQNWIEVEVNAADGRTAWLHRQDLQFMTWEEFILHTVAVDVLDASKNPIRAEPLENAAVLAEVRDASLRPIAVQGDWLLVSGYQDEEHSIPTGWIRWREGEKLLVDYSLLC